MPDDIRIIKQDQETTVDERGQLAESLRIQFKVGDDGPFLKRFTLTSYSAATARAELETFARELRALRGL